MAYGIIIAIVSLIGIIYGIKIKNNLVTIVSFIVLAATIAVWTYFYNNPY